MGKKRDYNRKEKRKAKRNNHQENQQNVISDYIPRRNSRPLEALNEAQGMYISAILNSDLTFSFGPAGTGKTYIAGALAAEQIENRTIDRIIRLGNHGGTCRGLIQTAENFNGVGQHFRSCHRPRVAGFGGLLGWDAAAWVDVPYAVGSFAFFVGATCSLWLWKCEQSPFPERAASDFGIHTPPPAATLSARRH